MVGMHDHDRRETRATEPIKELARHALRNDDRQPRVNAEPSHMRNSRNSAGQIGKLLIDERERIAAGENYFVDRRVGRDAVESRLPSGGRLGGTSVRILAAKAVPAMNRASPGCN